MGHFNAKALFDSSIPPKRRPVGALAAGQGIRVAADNESLEGAYFDWLASRAQSTVPITGAATLTSSAFGRWHSPSGSSDYTIGLPSVSGNVGKLIGFHFEQDAGVLVTLNGDGAETVVYQLTRSYMAGESVVLMACGDHWHAYESLIYPEFRAGMSSSQAAASTSTWYKLQFGNEGSDPFGVYDPTANYRFTANRPGKWYLELYIQCAGSTMTDAFVGYEKNATSGVPNQNDFIRGAIQGSAASSRILVVQELILAKDDYIHACANIASANTPTAREFTTASKWKMRWIGHD